MNKKGQILIVDDDEGTFVTLSRILRKQGYDVEIAHSGREALEKMKTDPVNLVFLDTRLPDMGGIDLMSTWRKKYPDTDIIMITGNASVDVAVKTINQGAVAFLVKPLVMDQLLALINSLMEKQQLKEEKFRNERRIAHLVTVLKAARDVSKLMLREKEQDTLIQGVCDALIRTHGCESSWIILTDTDMSLKTSASAGVGKNFIPIIDKFKSKELPHCCKLAIENPGVAIITDPEPACNDCILSSSEKDNGVITYHLEYRGRMFGFLYVNIPKTFISDEEIQDLVEDVARDLSFALFTAELEDQHWKAQDELKKIYESGEIRDMKTRSPDQVIPGSVYNWKDKLMLIVEDNESNYFLLKETLKKTRVQILWVTKGQEAIEICRATENIDLIVMDVRLPDMNGAEVTRQIRMFENELPIIALTAYYNPEGREKCMNAGCDDYVDKLLKPDMFLSLVNKYLKTEADANIE